MQVWFQLSKACSEETAFPALCRELTESGMKWKCCSKMTEELLARALANEVLLVSDLPEVLAVAKQHGVPVYGIETTQALPGCSYVALSVSALSLSALSLAYAHQKGIPALRLRLSDWELWELTEEEFSLLASNETYSAYQHTMYHFYELGYWAIHSAADGRFVGACGVEVAEYNGVPEYQLGYFVLPDERRKGIASTCVTALLRFLSEAYDLPEITALVSPDNTASLALLQALGFQKKEERLCQDKRILVYVRLSM